MFNCLIMGSGRSGTSAVAGILAKSGYYMGDNLIPPREANPKGFFECADINLHSNEEILRVTLPDMKDGTRWLSIIPLGASLTPTAKATQVMRRMVDREPFCYKDPRFSYTLPAWRPFLRNTKFVCVFRHPASTVKSILRECQTARYLRGFPITAAVAANVWLSMYEHILWHKNAGEWLFINYESIFQGGTLDRIESFLQAKVDRGFPSPELYRSTPDLSLLGDNDRIMPTYQALLREAQP